MDQKKERRSFTLLKTKVLLKEHTNLKNKNMKSKPEKGETKKHEKGESKAQERKEEKKRK
jgi:hypothetical protein